MSWLHPWGLLGLLSVPALVALSLWRWRRREVEVSSLHLWRQVAAQWRDASRVQRRRQFDPLVALRVAAAAVLTAALCGPAWWRTEAKTRRLTLVLDRSASMGARRPDGRSRWEACRDELLKLLGRLGPGDRVELVAVPAPGDLTIPPDLEPSEAAALLRVLSPSEAPVKQQQLIEAATAAERRHPGAQVVVATDERVEGLPAGVSVLAAGGSMRNRGIVAFAARRRPDGRHEVLVGVADASSVAASVEVALLGDGRELGRRGVDVAARRQGQAVFEGALDSVAVLEARLEGSDDLRADDRAWLSRRARPARVALVGPGNYCLRRALSVQEGVQVVELPQPPEEAVPPGCDLAVYYRAAPRRLARGPLVLAAPAEPVGSLRLGDLVEAGAAAVVARRDPLMTAVDLAGVSVGRVRRLGAPKGFETLAAAGDIPVVGRWQEGKAKVIYVGIDPAGSNWPLKASFPIFWANVVAECVEGLGQFDCVRPGQVVAPAWTGERMTLHEPDGAERAVSGGAFQPERVGLYKLVAGDREEMVAASLLSEVETTTVGSTAPLPSDVPEEGERLAGVAATWRLAGWLALAALALVVLHGWLTGRARGI